MGEYKTQLLLTCSLLAVRSGVDALLNLTESESLDFIRSEAPQLINCSKALEDMLK